MPSVRIEGETAFRVRWVTRGVTLGDVMGHIVTLDGMADDGVARDDGWHGDCIAIHDLGNRAGYWRQTMERFWNVTIERPDDGMVQTYASAVLREWCESAQIACIRVKAHMLPRGWRIVSCEPADETD